MTGPLHTDRPDCDCLDCVMDRRALANPGPTPKPDNVIQSAREILGRATPGPIEVRDSVTLYAKPWSTVAVSTEQDTPALALSRSALPALLEAIEAADEMKLAEEGLRHADVEYGRALFETAQMKGETGAAMRDVALEPKLASLARVQAARERYDKARAEVDRVLREQMG